MDDRWRSFFERYIREQFQISQSEDTRRAYRAELEPFFRDRDPANVTASEIHDRCYRDAATPRGPRSPAPQTVRCRLAKFRSFYRRAVDLEMLECDPTRRVRPPKPRPRPDRGFTEAEARAMFAAIPKAIHGVREVERRARETALLSVGFYMGLRRREIVSLTAGHFAEAWPDLKDGGLWIRVRTKGNKLRPVHVPPPVLQLIEAYLSTRGKVLASMMPSESIWNGLSPFSLHRIVKAIGRAAGIGRAATHDLRRSSAQFRDEAGIAIGVIQSVLGHTHRSTTDAYLSQGRIPAATGWRAVHAAITGKRRARG